MSKEILRKIGENSAYSAKGHFKTADIRRITIYVSIVVSGIFSIMAMSGLLPQTMIQVLSTVSLIATVVLLIVESHGGMSACNQHIMCGDQYLSLHNKAFVAYSTSANEVAEELMSELNAINESTKPPITYLGYKWAKKAIEKNIEMNIWWKDHGDID